MKPGRIPIFVALIVASVLLAACAAPATPTPPPAPTQPPAATKAPAPTQPPALTQPPAPTQAPVATQPPAPTTAPTTAPTATQAPAADTRGVLKYNAGLDYGGKENLDFVDPARFYPLIALLFDRLVEPTGNKLVPAPSLATSWEANKTGDAWTYHLRKDAYFHDGKQVTSADVAYSIDHWKNGAKSVLASTFGNVVGADTPDDFTVVFRLKSANFDFPQLTMDYRARIIEKGSFPDILKTGVGSGPFKLQKLDVQGITRVVANDKYWGGKPGVAAIDVYTIADNQAALQALQSGQIDFGYITPEAAKLFGGKSDYVVTQIPSGWWSGFVMRTDIAPFNNLPLRQALRMVIDRKKMLDLVYGGMGTLSCDTAVMPGDPYQLTWDKCTDGGQDIAGAKKKLAEAGYPNGFEITLYSSDLVAEWAQMAEIYQQQAAAAGIKVTIANAPSAGFYTETWMVKPFVMTNWNERGAVQALNEIYRGGGSWNESFWNVKEFDALLDKAAAEPNAETRRQYYLDAQQMLHQNGGTIIPFFTNTIRVQKSCVKNIPDMGVMYMVWTGIGKSTDCK